MRPLARDIHRLWPGLLALTVIVLVTAALVGVGCGRTPIDVSEESVQIPETSTTCTVAVTDEAGYPQGEDASLDSLGDAYIPQAGNGGYDVRHYDIVLSCNPRTGALEGNTSIAAVSLRELEAFNLDLAGLDVLGVELGGASVAYERSGQELTVECPQPLPAGSDFSVVVTYSGRPAPIRSMYDFLPMGWQRKGDTIYTLDEPEGAATWYPLNDHPSDKATYSFRLTVPEPYVAVATGVLMEIEENGPDRTFVWEMRQPMANYLAGVAVGDFVLEESVSPNGVPIRNYFDRRLTEKATKVFARTGEMLAYFSETFGPYPFEVYGVVLPDAAVGGAMENQTMSLFGRDLFQGSMSRTVTAELYISHELAHQWFGDSVTPAEWQDIWLNEGFATYASWLWSEHDRGEDGMAVWVDRALRAVAREDDVPPGDPGIDQLFGTSVYQRGALTLHALRLAVGDDLFFEIVREWVSRYRHGNATTEDFIALALEKAGHLPGVDVAALLDTWLFEKELPELPEQGSDT